MDAKIASAAKDLISNSQNEIKSSKQRVQELQNSMKKEKNINQMLRTEPDVYKSRLEELKANIKQVLCREKEETKFKRELEEFKN